MSPSSSNARLTASSTGGWFWVWGLDSDRGRPAVYALTVLVTLVLCVPPSSLLTSVVSRGLTYRPSGPGHRALGCACLCTYLSPSTRCDRPGCQRHGVGGVNWIRVLEKADTTRSGRTSRHSGRADLDPRDGTDYHRCLRGRPVLTFATPTGSTLHPQARRTPRQTRETGLARGRGPTDVGHDP